MPFTLQGVLCYMLLSGSPPFYGRTVEDVYKATSTQDPAFPDRKFRSILVWIKYFILFYYILLCCIFVRIKF